MEEEIVKRSVYLARMMNDLLAAELIGKKFDMAIKITISSISTLLAHVISEFKNNGLEEEDEIKIIEQIMKHTKAIISEVTKKANLN